MLRTLSRKKPISSYRESLLLRSLTSFDLVFMGIGAIIGAGVFILTGIAAATKAGPAIVLSYSIAGFAAMLAALAYAELAASIGGAGSAYSYAYAGFGELIAWLIGWNLLLEYTMAVSTVAIGWSSYVNNLLEALHIYLPADFTQNIFEDGIINLPAVLIILALTGLLAIGVKQSVRFNAVIVFIKLITIAVFICVATTHVNINNWEPFLPFGWIGVMQGAALVFFAYIGFDALSTAVDETLHPQKSIPIGIIVSLIICTLIYIIVSGLLTAIVPYYTLDVASPVSDALLTLGHPVVAGMVAAGAVAGLTTVMLVMFYGLTRIGYAMAYDGLLPKMLADIHPQSHTPVKMIVISGIIIAVIAGFSPIHRAAELVNIGTLAAFAFVSIGIIILRKTHPELPRPFRMPFSPFLPALGALSCIYLMLHLPFITWMRFWVWTLLGIIIYFSYSIRRSRLANN